MTALKSLLLWALPDRLLTQAKRLRYPGVIRDFRPPHGEVLRALVRPGDDVIDLGANIGWYTRVFSELAGRSGRVFSLEPLPPTFALLSYCARRLALGNVSLFNCAASDRQGSVLMEVPHYSGGGENYYEARIVGGDGTDPALRMFSVPVVQVDALLAPRLRRLTFVKCDVEGHELAVIRGARATIARWRPGLLVEVSGDPDEPGSSAQALVSELADVGYAAYRFDAGHLARRKPGDRAVDYFFLTDEHVARLRQADVLVE